MARRDYVQITRDEFEEWLNGLPWKWSRKQGRQGVYYVHFSDNVGCAISATIGRNDSAVGRGQGSMNLYLASLVSGQTLNRKARDRRYFQRTKNWRKTWKEGIDHWLKVYQDKQGFYERIAVVQDRDAYQADMTARIEAIPGWESDRMLSSFHEQVGKGRILSEKQEAVIERAEAEHPDAEDMAQDQGSNPNRLDYAYWTEIARELYRAAQRANKEYALGLANSVGRRLSQSRDPTERQWRAFLNILDEAGIRYDINRVPSNIAPRRASKQQILAAYLGGR